MAVEMITRHSAEDSSASNPKLRIADCGLTVSSAFASQNPDSALGSGLGQMPGLGRTDECVSVGIHFGAMLGFIQLNPSLGSTLRIANRACGTNSKNMLYFVRNVVVYTKVYCCNMALL